MIKFRYHNAGTFKVAELIDEKHSITSVDDVLDLFGELYDEKCTGLIIKNSNLNEDFFDLKTKLAGEILQKFSNYGFRLAVTGDFSQFTSKSLQDFIRESNKGRSVFFVADTNEALNKLKIK